MPRSRYAPTPDDQLRVRELAAIGMSQDDIAAQLRLPVPAPRKQELHTWAVLLAEAEAEPRFFLNAKLETPGMERTDRLERILAAERAA